MNTFFVASKIFRIAIIILPLSLLGCGTTHCTKKPAPVYSRNGVQLNKTNIESSCVKPILWTSQKTPLKNSPLSAPQRSQPATASAAGEQVLNTGRYMTIVAKEVVKKTCWSHLDRVYTRAGYPHGHRIIAHQGSKNQGPYISSKQLIPGDWLHFINYDNLGTEHSGIFVRWIDKSEKIGEILGCNGHSVNQPIDYKNYDLTSIYQIIRPRI